MIAGSCFSFRHFQYYFQAVAFPNLPFCLKGSVVTQMHQRPKKVILFLHTVVGKGNCATAGFVWRPFWYVMDKVEA